MLLAADVPGCDGQHYTRDVGFAIDGVFFVGRPRLAVRQRELIGLRPLVERMSKVAYLDCGTIEGGDVILHEGKVIVGLGEETSGSGIDSLEYRLRTLGNDREVVRIEFSRRGVVHLDTLFNVVSGNTALIHRTAFAKESLEWLEAHFDLIDVTDAEFLNVEVNTFTLDPTTVIVARGSERIGAELQRRGIEPVFIDYSEVTRIPGSFRCSTMPLTRADP